MRNTKATEQKAFTLVNYDDRQALNSGKMSFLHLATVFEASLIFIITACHCTLSTFPQKKQKLILCACSYMVCSACANAHIHLMYKSHRSCNDDEDDDDNNAGENDSFFPFVYRCKTNKWGKKETKSKFSTRKIMVKSETETMIEMKKKGKKDKKWR